MNGKEAEAEHVHRIHLFATGRRSIQLAGITFDVLLPAISIAGHTETKFQVILCRILPFIMIHHHARVLDIPTGCLSYLLMVYCTDPGIWRSFSCRRTN